MNILIIGAGNQTMELHLPILKDMYKNNQINLCLKVLVDIKAKDQVYNATKYIETFENSCEYYNVKIVTDYYTEQNLFFDLDRIAKEYSISVVIIAVDPMHQFIYNKWAISRGLNVFTDKPLSVHKQSCNNITSAKKILEDAIELINIYENNKNNGIEQNVMINTQRRYNIAYNEIISKAICIREKTNCPITFVSITHNDGQWRNNYELLNNSYHGYSDGFGKLVHSGYHLIDLACNLIKRTMIKELNIDSISVSCTSTKVEDILFLQSQFIDNSFKEKSDEMSTELTDLQTNNYGEVDAFITILFKHKDIVISRVVLNLLHSGFSQRIWENNYVEKYNGRVKHEQVLIYQGPYAYTILEKFKDKSLMNVCDSTYLRCQVNKVLEDPVSVINKKYENSNNSSVEKIICVKKFYESVLNKSNYEQQISSLEQHLLSIKVLSMCYQSLALQQNNLPNTVIESIESKELL